MSALPQDLLIDILKRLPIKPIGQFKCVSKAWRSLLSSPGFVRPHLQFHKDDSKELIVTASWSYGFDPDYYIVTLAADETDEDDDTSETADENSDGAASEAGDDDATTDENPSETAAASETCEDNASKNSDGAASESDEAAASRAGEIDAEDPSEIADEDASETSSDGANREGVARKGQFPVKQKILLAGSCDGLVLLVLQDKECSKILFNPITKESAKVVDKRDLVNSCVYGFGYDSLSDDYKIVSLSKLADGNGSLVDVYSVRKKSWKRTGNSRYVLQNTCFPDDEDECPAPGVFLNGCIHWLGSATNPPNHGYEIVCFDLAREEFVEVPIVLDKVFKLARRDFDEIPNPDDRRVEFDISVIDGCLALAMLPADVVNQWWHIHVWVMKEYGVRDSWTKIAHLSRAYYEGRFVKIVCALNEDEIVIAVDRDQLCAYNMRNKGWRRLDIAAFPWDFHTVLPFRGSLLSPS